MRGAGVVLLVGGLLVGSASCGPGRAERIVIGSKNFTEQIVLAEMLAQQIETRPGPPVGRKVNLGGTMICHEALLAGAIDLYVEYTGTALTAVLNEPPAHDPSEVYNRVRAEYARRFALEWARPLGFNNTFAMVIRGEDARRLGLTTISETAAFARQWRPGFGYEFMERPDGFRGLIETYDLQFGSPPRTMELGLIYRALKEKKVDIVAGNSTDGVIAALDLVVLEDDRGYFPPYEAAPVVRVDSLGRHPRLRAALDELAGTISDQTMRRLNLAVDGGGRDVAEVAREFRRDLGLVPGP